MDTTVDKMSLELSTYKQELEEYNSFKSNAKYLSLRNKELENTVKRVAAQHIQFDDNASLTPDKMAQMLAAALQRNKLLDQTKDEDRLLLTKAESILDNLRHIAKNTEDPTTMFRSLVTNMEKDLPTDTKDISEEFELHVNIGYFVRDFPSVFVSLTLF